MVIPTIDSFLTLVITFTTLGLGYASLYVGYWLANQLEEFRATVGGTDKIMQSFVIGSVMLIWTLLRADIQSAAGLGVTESVRLLINHYSFIWIASTGFITILLIQSRN